MNAKRSNQGQMYYFTFASFCFAIFMRFLLTDMNKWYSPRKLNVFCSRTLDTNIRTENFSLVGSFLAKMLKLTSIEIFVKIKCNGLAVPIHFVFIHGQSRHMKVFCELNQCVCRSKQPKTEQLNWSVCYATQFRESCLIDRCENVIFWSAHWWRHWLCTGLSTAFVCSTLFGLLLSLPSKQFSLNSRNFERNTHTSKRITLNNAAVCSSRDFYLSTSFTWS